MKKDKQNYSESDLYKIRHTCEHVFNQAVEELFPGKVLRAMGPVIEDGWYNDSRWSYDISEDDFKKIEKRMKHIIKQNLPMVYKEVSEEEAREMFKNNPFKQEFIDEYVKDGKTLSVYYTGDPEAEIKQKNPDESSLNKFGLPGQAQFVDLCKGPHAESTGKIKAFILLSIAGAYWRGDENNEMLTRVYGTAFESQEEQDQYLERLEEAKMRDHRKVGLEQDLFMFHETSPGMPYWLPRGLRVYNELVQFWREKHDEYGYQEIVSPLINKKELYETSGHWDHYKEDMFIADMGENEVYGIKPMNCPNAMLVFGSKTRSYKDFPLRLSDIDRLHRFERSGALNGLFRVRSFQQDDSHNYITEDMIESEYKHVFELCEDFYELFGLEYSFRLGTRPEKFLGEKETWDRAEETLKEVLSNSGKEYFVLDGDGAFYGPKVDILMKDVLGREWQMGTIQLDFHQPSRFNLKYIDEDGTEKTPVCIHRVIYGSLERFLGIIIEHFAGAFPVWLHPEQAIVIPISDKQEEYAKSVMKKLKDAGIRTIMSEVDETLGNKIRKAQGQKVPYMLIVGDKETENESLDLRFRTGENKGEMSVEDFVKHAKGRIAEKSLEL